MDKQELLKLRLNALYDRYQDLTDEVGQDNMAGLDDDFIAAFDCKDIKACKYVLMLINNRLQELRFNL